MKVIDIQNAKIYQQNALVLDEVNFSLEEKDFVYLIGRTGSGKSSLLKTLYGELFLKNGTGMVADFNLTKLRKKDVPMLRRKIGIVFQDFQLLTDRSVQDNLLFVLKATGWQSKIEMQKRIEDVLELVGLKTKTNSMPHALSGGEQQRVSIARALLNNPKLILADEPTGNLDPETSEEIMKLLIAVAHEQNTAVVMATHDMSMVEKFPGRVVRVSDGKIQEVKSINHFDPFSTFELE